MKQNHVRCIALLLLLAIALPLGHVFHGDAHGATLAATACCDHRGHDGTGETAPVPFDQHQDADGCDSCCQTCACHAPLAGTAPRLGYTPIESTLVSVEPFMVLPDVYLSTFKPPQNLV